MASDRKLVEHDPSWGILRNNLSCGEVIDYKDAPAMGLEPKRQTNILANHTNREKLHLTFTFLREEEPLCGCQNPNCPSSFPLSPPPPSQFIKTFWLKVPDCVILSCSCARPVPPAPQIESLSKWWKKLKALVNLNCSIVDEVKFLKFWWDFFTFLKTQLLMLIQVCVCLPDCQRSAQRIVRVVV